MPITGVGNSGVTGAAEKIAQDASPDGEFNLQDPLGSGAESMKYYMELMAKTQAESRAFQALSNVLKARHDSARSAIQNIR